MAVERQNEVPPEVARGVAGMSAVLMLVVLLAVLLLFVLFAGRRARKIVRQQRRLGPSGRVGPSDWDVRPWSGTGGNEGPPEGGSAESDTRNE
jgi:hypothetical protein